MEFTRKHVFTLALSLLLGFVSVLPHVTHAVGSAADLVCVASQCTMTPTPGRPLCPTVQCMDVTNGFPTNGFCASPTTCKAVSTGGKDGFGLDQVAKILGDLMGKLMQQGGGQQPPSTPPTGSGGDTYRTPPSCTISSNIVSSNASSTTATLSWSSLGEATSASITPSLGSVSPTGSQTVTVTAATPYSMTVTGPGGTNYCSTTVFAGGDDGDGDECSALTEALYGCDDDGDDGDDGDDDTSTVALSASPTTGTSPLTVSFSINYSGQAGAPTLEYGDGMTEDDVDTCYAPADACISPGSNTHTYGTYGTYVAKLCRGTCISSANLIGSVTITVNAPSNQNTNTNTATTSTTTATVFTTPASYLVPGLRGDISVLNSGGTVFAGARDPGKNTEVAGFYGGSTFNGQATGVVASICRSRPWASNILSYVLPANFFDGLCVARGYQVGNPPPVQTQPTVTVTQTQPKPAATSTTTATTTYTGPVVPPRVRVWAVPATVSLGSRTSVFWTSQGVASCLVTSPDGSFSQTTLSGGASTVALTGDTTFTISCLTPDGTPVTDFVTVRLSI